jgi:hypothetical protein
VFDGTTPYIDTGISLVDEHKSFSVLFEFSNVRATMQSIFSEASDDFEDIAYKQGYAFCQMQHWNWRSGFALNAAEIVIGGMATNLKVVVTYDHTTNTHSQYHISDGALVVNTNQWNFNRIVGTSSGLRLGTGTTHKDVGFNGTIHSLAVYAKVVDEETIHEFMGVN